MKILYTDIDFVLSLGSEMGEKMTKWGLLSRFNAKAVKIYSEILLETGAYPVITSDWRHDLTLNQLQEIFTEWAKISKDCNKIIRTTSHISGATIQRLAEFRAKEILKDVEESKPETWVAIDDLDLKPWISDEHFVHLPRFMEGIKQCHKKEEIIKKLNNE
jgi:hypothetical protein